MDSALSAMNLKDDFQVCLEVEDAVRWQLVLTEPLEVRVTISPLQDPKESYLARFLWTVYPDEPPSMKFVDPATGRLDIPTAWPVVAGFRPGNLDACVNWTSEGFALHPQWKKDPKTCWVTHGNRQLYILRTLRDRMDETYQGRFKP